MHKQHHKLNYKKIKGFTLFELMIGLSLLAILSGYAIPSYRDLRLDRAMTESINELSATLRYARNQSIIRNRQIIACPSQNQQSCATNGNWHNGWLLFIDNNRDRRLDADDQLLQIGNPMPKSLTAKSSQYRKLIRYDQQGAATGTNLTINFCDQRGTPRAKSLIINNIGRPRVSQSGQCG